LAQSVHTLLFLKCTALHYFSLLNAFTHDLFFDRVYFAKLLILSTPFCAHYDSQDEIHYFELK